MTLNALKKKLKESVFKDKEQENSIGHIDLTYSGFFRLINQIIAEAKQEAYDDCFVYNPPDEEIGFSGTDI